MNMKSYQIFCTKAKAELPFYNHLPSISQHLKHNDYKLWKAREKKKGELYFYYDLHCLRLIYLYFKESINIGS